jgi:hypothetical protein
MCVSGLWMMWAFVVMHLQDRDPGCDLGSDRYDAHFFSNVWHDWNEAQCANLAARSFKALPSGGRILLHEMLLTVRLLLFRALYRCVW